MKLNEKNPTNSRVIQTLRDIETFGLEVPKDFFNNVDRNKKGIDEIILKHEYPMESLVFTKLSREFEILAKLPRLEKKCGTQAVSLLLLILENVGPNLKFSITRQDIMDLLECAKSTAIGATKLLVRYGIIAEFQKAKGRGNPTIYMLNPMIADVGKPSSKQDQELFWELAGDLVFRRFMEFAEKESTADVVKMEDKTQYVVIKPKPKEKAEQTEESEEQKKVTETKKESIPGLTEQQKQGIDSIFSSNY